MNGKTFLAMTCMLSMMMALAFGITSHYVPVGMQMDVPMLGKLFWFLGSVLGLAAFSLLSQGHGLSREVFLAEELKAARDALVEVGNDYPGSTCQRWCCERAARANKALRMVERD